MRQSPLLQNQKRKNRSYFTLIEVLLALTLIGLSLSIAVFPLKQAFDTWRFKKGVEELSQTLLQAKFISVCYGTDCYVVFHTSKQGNLEFYLESLEPLNSQIKKRHVVYGASKVVNKTTPLSSIAFYSSGFHKPAEQITILPIKNSLSSAAISLTSPFAWNAKMPLIEAE